MVNILYTKAFLRQYNKLPKSLQIKALSAIELFKTNPTDGSLESHKLGGKLKDRYSFSVDYKTRVIFEFGGKDEFVFLKIGDHDVYR
jgi:mRNA-degrading endonuclease YafQ of YafQ-DinJ toxin-antitoxin module